MTSIPLQEMRRDYSRAALDEGSTSADPMEQFRRWFSEAARAEVVEPNAMTLATADANARPSARIVLLKGIDHGFVFYTDFRSRKGAELIANPHAALVFHWHPLERQVRIVGAVERVSDVEAWEYYRTRPLGSRIGAWASTQSEVIEDRGVLEQRVADVTAEYSAKDIPLPPHWGGFRVVPHEIEFWQGRPSRLHDRIHYTRTSDQQWHRVRLSP